MDKSLEAYEKLYESMPSIGLLNRKKRIIAFLKVTKTTQKLIDNQEISEDNALYLLSVLSRKCASFQKSSVMAALNLQELDRKLLRDIGFKFANDLRCNMQMLPIDDIVIK